MHGRAFPWRITNNSYEIIVSEFMLQQTQTARVEKKYHKFLSRFPTLKKLAQSKLAEVLQVWQGLGYNRRAKFLHKTASIIETHYHGEIPDNRSDLLMLPGIGKATSGAMLAFIHNKPVVFIETNIRRVYLHYFFSLSDNVHDKEIEVLIQKTLPQKAVRQWYYALMDYGVMLASKGENANKKSAHYTKQSAFNGSERQIRGAILKELSFRTELEAEKMYNLLPYERYRITNNLKKLEKENLIVYEDGIYYLGDIR